MPTAAGRAFAWMGAALFALSLGYFLYTYTVTFGEISPETSTSTRRAIVWNVSLFGLFAIHHSVFARTPVRAWMATHVSPALERATYVWIASLLLVAVCASWEPVAGVAWTMTGAWRWIVRLPMVVGIWLALRSAGVIDVWELAGTRQLSIPSDHLPMASQAQQPAPEPEKPAEFKTSGPYGLVRHPIYLGWFLIVFSVPTMTMTRVVFAAASCVYLVLAIPFEERTLLAAAGQAYGDYMSRVKWRLVPGVW